MGVPDWLLAAPIAHRGFYEDAEGAPENSLAAFRRAVRHGMPFECDVQYSADGSPVVWHDATVGLPDGAVGSIGQLTGRQLAAVRLGVTDEPIPTLHQVLELVDGAVPVVLDVRRWTLDRHDLFERAVTDELRGYAGPVAVQSFDPLAVHRFRRLTPDRPVGQASGDLGSRSRLVAAIGRTMPTNVVTRPDFLTYEIARLPSIWTDLWRRRGVPLLAYSIDDERDEARARRLADNFFFGGYVPEVFRGGISSR